MKNNIERQRLLTAVSAFLVASILTVACGETATPQPTPTNTPNVVVSYDWANNWLKGIPCKAPCFEGITPGVTKANDALKLLKSYPYAKNVYASKGSGYSGSRIIWHWYNSEADNDLYYQNTDEIIYAILVRMSGVQLNKLIALYGEPDKIGTAIMRGDDPITAKVFYSVRIIYDEGLILIYSSVNTPPTLSGSLEFGYPYFYDPKRIAGDYNSGFQVSNWQGMKDFYFYCTDDQRCR